MFPPDLSAKLSFALLRSYMECFKVCWCLKRLAEGVLISNLLPATRGLQLFSGFFRPPGRV